MSAKRHLIVPREFASPADVPRDRLAKFHRMSAWEAKLLEAEGRIENIGGKFWRLTAEACATVRSSETGDGLLSREIPRWLRELMRLEMAGHAA